MLVLNVLIKILLELLKLHLPGESISIPPTGKASYTCQEFQIMYEKL